MAFRLWNCSNLTTGRWYSEYNFRVICLNLHRTIKSVLAHRGSFAVSYIWFLRPDRQSAYRKVHRKFCRSRMSRRASTPWRLPGITCHITIGTGKAMRKEPPQKGFFFLRRPLFFKWYKNLYNRSAAFARINA